MWKRSPASCPTARSSATRAKCASVCLMRSWGAPTSALRALRAASGAVPIRRERRSSARYRSRELECREVAVGDFWRKDARSQRLWRSSCDPSVRCARRWKRRACGRGAVRSDDRGSAGIELDANPRCSRGQLTAKGDNSRVVPPRELLSGTGCWPSATVCLRAKVAMQFRNGIGEVVR
jgi:hypothetical protein